MARTLRFPHSPCRHRRPSSPIALPRLSLVYELTACVACGSRESSFVVDAEGLRREREQLWEFHVARLHPRTPPQHLADRLAFSQPDAMRLVRCSGCGLLYRNPIEREHVVADLYAEEAPSAEVLEALHTTQLAAARAQARRLTRVVGRAATVLEVGSFVGGFLTAARELGWDARGVDVNAQVNRWLRRRHVVAHDGTLRDVPLSPPVTVVAFWNCFDQLADPAAALRDARQRLQPDGRAVIRVPNGDSYLALRRRSGPLAERVLALNNLMGFPYRYGFTRSSLARVLDRAGFAVERIVGDTLVPTADRWTRWWARGEEHLMKGAVRWVARAGAMEPPWLEVYARLR